MRRRRAALLALAALLVAAPAGAESVLIQPGPAGQDVSPYAFIPSLPRGQYHTAYAVDAELDGAPHDFEYYLKFDLPAGLRGEVEYAYVWFYYGFGFEGFGAGSGGTGPGQIRCHAVQAPWQEDAVTWNARPPIGPPLYVHSGIRGFGTVFCKLTDLVQGWIDGSVPNHGIAVTSAAQRVIGMFTFEATLPANQIPPGLTMADLRPSLLIRFRENATSDVDGDGFRDRRDNCPGVANPGQEDWDGDRVGDVCDVCPAIKDKRQRDRDGDGRGNRCERKAVDLNRDGRVDADDLALAAASVGARRSKRAYRKKVDTNRDRRITPDDLDRWLSVYLELQDAESREAGEDEP